ncbi:adenylyl-sulfate kinase [Nocardioides nanhaiensis]|uniref:Adenylyl-sulfate kinase n=1 Tax=Nocardioides nanhaiensis TaxID=1476871 RepID=A0ABP8VV35_9ACTN
MSTPTAPQPAPQHCPSPRELDDLELLGHGGLAPLTGFNEPGSPVTLELPEPVLAAAREAGAVELVDPEGLPLARVAVPAKKKQDGEGWPVQVLATPEYGPYRRYHLSPAQVRAQHAGRTVVPVTDALTDEQLRAVHELGPVLLLALTGHGTPAISPVALLRATLLAAEVLDAVVVAVPLASHGDAQADHDLGVQVVRTYAGDDPVHALTEGGELPLELREVVERDRPAPGEQGLVIFFTGLSGSGKSTLARALMDQVLEQGERTLTSLDGDVVRRNLSAGLTFSKEDRETNIRRIGWVAAEIARHGGVAVCSPIAPFDATRQQVRQMVDDAGGAFFLVHVATPLEECERRDRKGLYKLAREGKIPEFTGISSPYEQPADADVVVDTTGRTIEDALADVVDALAQTGHLTLVDDESLVDPAERDQPLVEPGERDQPLVEPGERQRARVETPQDDRPPATTHTAEADEPLKVLFVCTANICRSPYMELLARRIAEETGAATRLSFASAGTHGFREHAMDDVMATTLTSRGVAHDEFRSQRLTSQLIADADLVLTAESTHRQFILDDHPGDFRKVFTLGQFAESVRSLHTDLTGRQLLAAAGLRRGGASERLDIGDPYRRGPEAAASTAERVEELLRVVVPALAGAERITP